MTNKKYFLLVVTTLILLFNRVYSQKISIYGSILENGIESKCNWYFEGDKACMELIFRNQENSITTMRIIMNSANQQLKIVTLSNESRNCYSTIADSIKDTKSKTINFVSTHIKKEFDIFGICTKIQARDVTNEYLIYVFENENINLSRFQTFIKNDKIFEFISSTKSNQFPVQAITTLSNGELQRSYLAETYSLEVPSYIFSTESCN